MQLVGRMKYFILLRIRRRGKVAVGGEAGYCSHSSFAVEGWVDGY